MNQPKHLDEHLTSWIRKRKKGGLPFLKIQHPMQNPSNNAGDMLCFSLLGDALALGPHWIYDQDEIHAKLGRVTSLHDPIARYHQGKSAGDLTHYGDQTLLLLRSIAKDGRFDLSHFAARWRAFWEDPKTISYRDGATRKTLEHLQSGLSPERAGSDSHDIGGAVRIGPLFLLSWPNDNALIEAVRNETAFTHSQEQVVESAEFFCRVILALRSGATIPEALDSVKNAKTWSALPAKWFEDAHASAKSDASDSAALKTHGLSCNTDGAFQGNCHFLLRYPDDPTTALIENATAGGDSAARGLILGLVYGAKFSPIILPADWLSPWKAHDEVIALIQTVSANANAVSASCP